MPQAYLRFYAELNDFLPPEKQQRPFSHTFELKPTVKDMIEAQHVPHAEVDLILVNGQSVDFDYHVQDGDRISIYPVFESFDVSPLIRLRPEPLRDPRFVLDVHLGRLATYLRMLGFDTRYRNDFSDDELAQISANERRILLTRDRGLLMRNIVTHGFCLTSTDPRQQLAEVVRRFDLFNLIKPFQRCLRCNQPLQPVDKADISERLLPKTRQYYDEFKYCRACDQVYWKGSHYRRMQQLIKNILHPTRPDG